MQVTKNKVVAIDYCLKDDDGQVVDTSEGAQPLQYLHGVGEIIPGLERELEGKNSGDQFQVTIQPSDAYGSRNPELIQRIARENFEDPDNLELGMVFQTEDEDGGMVFAISEIDGDEVVVDANHMLAGMTLHFDVTVRDIRDATEEEIEHQHAHYPGDEHHH